MYHSFSVLFPFLRGNEDLKMGGGAAQRQTLLIDHENKTLRTVQWVGCKNYRVLGPSLFFLLRIQKVHCPHWCLANEFPS